jgi:hypoxanthine phosphoribosyltransferase
LAQLVNPSEYLQNAELIHSQDAVNLAITAIATQLNLAYANEPPMVLCVMGGAVYFTGQLLSQLTFALELDYVQATRYHGNTEGTQLKWVVMPKENINNRNVLILDDILDEGLTLKAVADQCILQGAKEVKVAVLAEKLLNKPKPISANYVGLLLPNRYVFGCGMDICGWWRNLPAIYALKNCN